MLHRCRISLTRQRLCKFAPRISGGASHLAQSPLHRLCVGINPIAWQVSIFYLFTCGSGACPRLSDAAPMSGVSDNGNRFISANVQKNSISSERTAEIPQENRHRELSYQNPICAFAKKKTKLCTANYNSLRYQQINVLENLTDPFRGIIVLNNARIV